VNQILLGAKITFRGLHGGVAEQQLDLLQLATGGAAQLGASAASLRIADILIMGINGHLNITSARTGHQTQSPETFTRGVAGRIPARMASG
jgi:hypothetical protein